MSAAVPEFPARPGDVPALAPLGDVLSAVGRHRGRLVDAAHGLGEPQPAGQVAAHAVAALATAHALAERLLDGRWTDAADALAHGATLDQVAAAMGLDVVELRVGMRSWADAQQSSHEHYGSGGLTPAEADEVRALVDDPGGAW
ncbi:MAG: hypothetical protein L0I76_32075 [Pseudonocardia sp.]|nr:hypothetical protein [Pseudonocardia sp.]